MKKTRSNGYGRLSKEELRAKILKRKKADTTAQKMKAAGIAPLIRKGEWQTARPKTLEERRRKAVAVNTPMGLSKESMDEVRLAIVDRRAAGMTDKEISEEFHIGTKEVNRIINGKYAGVRKGAEALRSILLENSLLLGNNVRNKAKDMNGMQSAVATGIMTSKFIELDKHLAKQPENIDTESLSEMGEQLRELNDLVKDQGGEMSDEDID